MASRIDSPTPQRTQSASYTLPPHSRTEDEPDDLGSITASMTRSHQDQGLGGTFANTQNPGAYGSFDLIPSRDRTSLSVGSRVDLNVGTPSHEPLQGDDELIDDLDLDPPPPRTGSDPTDSDRRPHGAIGRNPQQPSLAGRAMVNTEKKNTWPKTKALVGSLVSGAAGTAAGAAIAGGIGAALGGSAIGAGASGALAALGTAVTFGAIGAGVGSTVPIVGTVIGGVIGIGVGIAYGLRAKAKQDDLLDTTRTGMARKIRRQSKFAWARSMDPAKLGRFLSQNIPLVSGRRAAAVRLFTQARNCCVPIAANQQIKWEDRGRNATVNEAKGALRYAVAADAAYGDVAPQDYATGNVPGHGWNFTGVGSGAHFLTRANALFNELPESLKKSLGKDGTFVDEDTGNRIMIHYDETNNEVVMAFCGTEGSGPTAGNQARGNYAQWFGGVPPSIEQAVAVGRAVREAVARYNQKGIGHPIGGVVSVGHSRGGLQAAAEAIKNGGRAVTFNPEAMGPGVRGYCNLLRSDRVPPGTSVTNFSVRNDWVSGSGVASGIGNAFETVVGIPTALIPGDRLILAKAPNAATAHADPIKHVAYRAGGGQAARRARFAAG